MVTIQAIYRATNLIIDSLAFLDSSFLYRNFFWEKLSEHWVCLMVTLWTKDYFNEILIAHEGRIVSIDTQGFPHWRGIREFPHTSQKIANPPARKTHTKKLPHYIKTSML